MSAGLRPALQEVHTRSKGQTKLKISVAFVSKGGFTKVRLRSMRKESKTALNLRR